METLEHELGNMMEDIREDAGNSYEDILISLMRSENISHLSESKMLSFLIINSLTYKMIPKELYEGNELKFMDGAFCLT